MKIVCVVGARPNFIKIAPILDEIKNHTEYLETILVHTGQHYDERMSELFFKKLEIPKPDINLGVGSGSHAVQTAEVMKRFEKVCLRENPAFVLVVGDVNSTIACALVAAKLQIGIIHVEAGLRSFDRQMPEEINRILTDSIADILFTTEKSANINLRNEGIPDEKVFFVGNVMIDTLLKHIEKAAQSNILEMIGLHDGYGLMTLHRPSNVDNNEKFYEIINAIAEISKRLPIFFPLHPRTLKKIKAFGFEKHFRWDFYETKKAIRNTERASINGFINALPSLDYLDFLQLMSNASLVLTDSGGIQEETTILNVPCVTLRENTERPVTISHGTNTIGGNTRESIVKIGLKVLYSEEKNVKKPPLWDGKASRRVVDAIVSQCLEN